MSVLGMILLIVLLLMLVGSVPAYPYSRAWSYYPSSIVGMLLVVLVIGLAGILGVLGVTQRLLELAVELGEDEGQEGPQQAPGGEDGV